MDKVEKLFTEIRIDSYKDMLKFGKLIAMNASPGMIIALSGSLGVGKTTFVKGLAKGLDIEEEITSPSFPIIKEYHEGKLPLFHMDLYRIDNTEELILLGFDDFIYGTGVSVIEWSEKAGDFIPDNAVKIFFSLNKDLSRTITIRGLKL